MAEEVAQEAEVQKAQKKKIPLALPIDIQRAIKEDVRDGYGARGKHQIVLTLMSKYQIAQRTAYDYIDRTILEDEKDLDKRNVLMEIMADRKFRKRLLMTRISRMLNKEATTANTDRPYTASDMVLLALIRQLAEEDKGIISMLQELAYIQKPLERTEVTGEFWMGNILAKIQENINRSEIYIKKVREVVDASGGKGTPGGNEPR
jgi:hypothetical protein